MPRKGFFQPSNFEEKGGGGRFKEGNVRVDDSYIAVVHPDVPAGQEDRGAYTAMCWAVTRLNEELQPLSDDDGNPLKEVLVFGMGGRSLAAIHPGQASAPDDNEVEDQGSEDGARGNTIYFVDDSYKLDKRSGVSVLMMSLSSGKDKAFPGAGVKSEYLDRIWAPDWRGCVFHMKSWVDQDNKTKGSDGQERGIPYKIVTKVLTGPGAKGGGKAVAGAAASAPAQASKKASKPDEGDNQKAAPAAAAASGQKKGKADSNGSGTEHEKLAIQILNRVSEQHEGQPMTFKALYKAASEIAQEMNVAPADLLPVMKVYKDDGWLTENQARFDMTVNVEEREVVFA